VREDNPEAASSLLHAALACADAGADIRYDSVHDAPTAKQTGSATSVVCRARLQHIAPMCLQRMAPFQAACLVTVHMPVK
jgi:hypothetical protein